MKELKLNELKSTAKLISVTFLGFVVERKYEILHLNVEWVLCWIWNWKKRIDKLMMAPEKNSISTNFNRFFFSKKKTTTKILFKNKSFWKVALVCHFEGGKIPFDTFIATHDTMNYFNCFFFVQVFGCKSLSAIN